LIDPYVTDRVAKAIHLVRDPFDNVVSRFRFNRKIKSLSTKDENKNVTTSEEELRDKFRSACLDRESDFFLKGQGIIRSFMPEFQQKVKKIPCFIEFFKYANWHNSVFAMTKDMSLETLVFHYDAFNENMGESLTTFLDLTQHGSAPIFHSGRNHRQYFTSDEVDVISNVLEQMSSTETWSEIKRYLLHK